MILRQFYVTLLKTQTNLYHLSKVLPNPSPRFSPDPNRLRFLNPKGGSFGSRLMASASRSGDARRRNYAPLPPASADKVRNLPVSQSPSFSPLLQYFGSNAELFITRFRNVLSRGDARSGPRL
ncbi:hypothetical protein KSP40_PGU013956 [Platanthera guangdongensis]|uniref:Uncharacterized protein n=1 Tax=Platanthera guangdongensis TaxID=2320717 RepID=A0ABR2LVJ9_9ASPA